MAVVGETLSESSASGMWDGEIHVFHEYTGIYLSGHRYDWKQYSSFIMQHSVSLIPRCIQPININICLQ
jgi:hypothetical protein